jgi:hypothetical protein
MGTETRKEGTIVTLTHKGLENFHHLGEDFILKVSEKVGKTL